MCYDYELSRRFSEHFPKALNDVTTGGREMYLFVSKASRREVVALGIGAWMGYLNVVEFVLGTWVGNSKDKDKDIMEAMRCAAFNGRVEVVRRLLQLCLHGPTAETTNSLNETDKGLIKLAESCMDTASRRLNHEKANAPETEERYLRIIGMLIARIFVSSHLDLRKLVIPTSKWGQPDTLTLILTLTNPPIEILALSLLHAADKGHTQIIPLLISHGAPIESPLYANGLYVTGGLNARETPLYESVFKSHFETTKLLLSHGADPNGCNGRILPMAISRGRIDIVKLLLESGAEASKSTETFFAACETGNAEMMEIVVKAGGDALVRGRELALLMPAVRNGQAKVVRYLYHILRLKYPKSSNKPSNQVSYCANQRFAVPYYPRL